MGDPFYHTTEWKNLRRYVLERDRYRCSVIGCKQEATIVDHIVGRRDGGSDHPHNLRCMCKLHDNQVKERSNRRRGRNGVLPARCDVDGMPMDPKHPWYRKR